MIPLVEYHLGWVVSFFVSLKHNTSEDFPLNAVWTVTENQENKSRVIETGLVEEMLIWLYFKRLWKEDLYHSHVCVKQSRC